MKKKQNVLEMFPRRREQIQWCKKDNQIQLQISRNKKLDQWMHRIFKSPQVIHVQLDELGSYVWEQCNGRKSVQEIVGGVKETYGSEAEPILERLLVYIGMLHRNQLIEMDIQASPMEPGTFVPQ